MGHYDECRPGYCGGCGAGPGDITDGVCRYCSRKGTRNAGKEAASKSVMKDGVSASVFSYEQSKQNTAVQAANALRARAFVLAKAHAAGQFRPTYWTPGFEPHEWVVQAIMEALQNANSAVK